MRVSRYAEEDVFARVPEVAAQTDPVLRHLDRLLDDDVLFSQVKADLARRHPRTLGCGRHSTPVEVILRLLIVKHLYQWSFQETQDRVNDSLVLRWFSRVYFEHVPDDTTLIRWASLIRPETMHTFNDRVVELASQAKVIKGRKLRVDGTCVQTTIHHPTDSGLLVDSVRELSRFVERAKHARGRLAGESVRGLPLADTKRTKGWLKSSIGSYAEPRWGKRSRNNKQNNRKASISN